MNIFEVINMLSRLLVIVPMMLVVIVAFIIVYVKWIYKPKPEIMKYDMYEGFERKNVEDYIPITDIDEDGVMLMEDGETYVAALLCKGFDFFYAHPREQMNANLGYVDYIQSIKSQQQLRISTRQEDLEGPISEYEQEKLAVMTEMTAILDEAALLESAYDTVDSETKAVYAQKMIAYDKKIQNMNWELEHIDQIVEYMKEMSSTNAAPTRESSYIIEWTYNSNEFPEGTTDYEILQRAKKELKGKADSMKSFLRNANVNVKRATDKELRELIRGHMQPFGKNMFKASDIEKSNHDELVVTSDSLKEAIRRYNEFQTKIENDHKRIEEIKKAGESDVLA